MRSDEAFFVVDNLQRVVEWSRGATDALGLRGDEALGRECYAVLRELDPSAAAVCQASCSMFRALAEGALSGACFPTVQSRASPETRLRGSFTALPNDTGGGVITVAGRPAAGRAAESGPGTRSAPPSHGGAPSSLVSDLAALGTLATSLSPDSLDLSIEQSLKWIAQTTRMESAELFLVEPNSEDMLLAAYRGPFRRAFYQVTRFRPGEGFPGLVKVSEASVVTADLQGDSRYLRTQVKEKGFRCYVCVPLATSRGVVGTLNVGTRKRNVDTERALRLLTWASHPIGVALQAGLLQLRESVTTTPVANSEGWDGDLEGVLRAVLRRVMLVGRATGGSLAVYDGEGRGMVRRVKEGDYHAMACPDSVAHDPNGCPAMVTGESVSFGPPRDRDAVACPRTHGKGAVVHCLPLVYDGERVGIIQVGYSRGAPPPPTGGFAAMLSAATQAANVVRRTRLNHEERERSLRLSAAQRSATEPQARPEVAAPQRELTGAAAPHTPYLDIRCFGSFALYKERKLLTADMFKRRGALTILKILLINGGRPVSREALIEALWPEVDPKAGANRLYVLVHALRRMIEPEQTGHAWLYIRNDGDRYHFNRAAPHQLDIDEFRGHVSLGERLEREGDLTAAVDAYEAAVSLYTGDLLGDETYDEWCWTEREHLKERCLDVLRTLGSFYLEHSSPEKSLPHYRHALWIDPLREESYRGLMRALWATGRRDEALHQYQLCRDVLRRDMGVDPLPETVEMHALILNNIQR